MKFLAMFLVAMAVAANVQAATKPYVIPIYRVTKEAATTTEATTEATTETTTETTADTTAATTTDPTSATPKVPASLMDKFSYVLEDRQGRHPRALIYDNKPRVIEGFIFEHVCSGTLVDNSAIITTITCIESAMRDTIIKPCVSTAHDPTSTVTAETILYEVEKHIAHPEYDSATNMNNIAVLKLATEVDFTMTDIGYISWALEIPAPKSLCTISFWDAATPFIQVIQDVVVETCTSVKEGTICSSYTPTLSKCPFGANGASLVCDSKIAGIFSARRNSDCTATLWQYEEISKDATWIWENVNAAPILNVSFAAILVLITAMINNM